MNLRKSILLLLALPGIASAQVIIANPSISVPNTPVPTLPQTTQELNNAAPPSTGPLQGANPLQGAGGLPPLPSESSLYKSGEKSLLPLKAKDIKAFRKRLNRTERAAQSPIAPPQAVTRVITLHPNRGNIPVIPMSAGYVTDVTFTNEWGQPWHVVDASTGDGAAFRVLNPTSAGSVTAGTALKAPKAATSGNAVSAVPTSTIMIAATEKYRDSNLSVLLHQLPTPLLFNLQTGNAEVDYRVIVRVSALPANAMPPVGGMGRSHDAADAILMRALYDTMPRAARAAPFGYGTAWRLNGKLWVRTRHSILSPAWLATLQTGNGVHAYELPNTRAVMLMVNGNPITTGVQ